MRLEEITNFKEVIMAQDSIMGNLFGVSPAIYEQNKEEATRKQAIEFAKLDPYERTNQMAFVAGRGLGNIVGGALGAQDPVMMMLSQRAELGQKYDLSKPEQWALMSKELLAKNDPEGAQIALQKGTDLELKQSQITRNLRERQGLDPVQQIIRSGKYTPQSIAEYEQTGDITRLALVEKPEKDFSFGQEREAKSREKYGVNFSKLTQEQQATINKLIEDEKGTVAERGAVKVYPPGAPVAQKDWMDFRKFVDSNPTMKKTSALISEAPSAFDTINRITGNDIAAKALPATLARLTGETGPLSKADIQRFARTGGLDDRLAQSATEFFSGRGTKQQKEEAQKYVSAIYRGALIEQKNFVVNEAKQLGYTKSPNYESFIQSIDEQLGKFKQFTPPPKTNVETPPASEVKPSGQTGFSARRIN